MHPDTHLVLEEKTIQVWHCSFDVQEKQLSAYFDILSEDEKQKAVKFKFKKDENCYIISRGILRSLLGGYLNIVACGIQFNYTPFGKPCLAFETDLKFNISHSGNKAAFAFYRNQEVGVDIERVKDDFDVLELAQNFFSSQEIAVLEQQAKEDLPNAFFRCWTRKESFIKAEGSGLSFPLDKFTVSLENDNEAELLETHFNPEEKKEWTLFSLVPEENYIAAVAVKDQVRAISHFDYDSFQQSPKN